jgi:hypothetical protein
MRVSIWQQFSSNHSASFSLVGQFESAEWAEQVADDLRNMLQAITDWWAQFDDREEATQIENRFRRKGQLTPPEEEFQKQYGVEWSKDYRTKRLCPLDWIGPNAANAVSVYKNVIFIQPRGDTWIGPQPLDAIMRGLGGRVAAECEVYDSYLAVTITCDAPDEVTAEAMVAEVKSYMTPNKRIIRTIPSLDSTQFEVAWDGKRVVYSDYQLHGIVYHRIGKIDVEMNLQQQFDALMEYLTRRGCVNIDYRFHEIPYELQK